MPLLTAWLSKLALYAKNATLQLTFRLIGKFHAQEDLDHAAADIICWCDAEVSTALATQHRASNQSAVS
jgi:hypothetical protein